MPILPVQVMDGSGQARRRGPVFVGKTFPRVVGSCSSGILTPCSCAVRWVRQVRDWTPLLSHCWTFTVDHSGALGSKNPVESNWYSLVSPARILEWKNHLCWLSEELLNCYTWRERIKVGVRKIHFYCASSTADGGMELRTRNCSSWHIWPRAASFSLVLQQGWCGGSALPVTTGKNVTCGLFWLPDNTKEVTFGLCPWRYQVVICKNQPAFVGAPSSCLSVATNWGSPLVVFQLAVLVAGDCWHPLWAGLTCLTETLQS